MIEVTIESMSNIRLIGLQDKTTSFDFFKFFFNEFLKRCVLDLILKWMSGTKQRLSSIRFKNI